MSRLIAFTLLGNLLLAVPTWGALGDELRRIVPTNPVSNQDFGDAIDVGGGLVLVGAEDTPRGATPSSGRAYLFDANTGSELIIIDSPNDGAFGSAVALDGNNLIVAAEDEAGVTGAAYIFDTSGNQLHRLQASDAAANHEFGQGVAIQGNMAVVSAPGANTFRGQLYRFDVTTGQQIGDPLFPLNDDPMPGNDLNPGDEFGNSMGFDGNHIIAGIDRAGLGGAAYIFEADGTQLHKLEPPIDPMTMNPVRGFGRQVAISGNVALVGATPDADQVFPGEVGRAYLFDVTTGDLLFELLPNDSQGEDLFSEDLDLSGNLALVGARHEAALGTINTAYLFDVNTGLEVAQLMPGPGIVAQDEALEGIALDGTFAVGGVESFDSPGFANNGIALIFDADLGLVSCDFDGSGVCDTSDIDMLIAEIAAGTNGATFDLTGDGQVDLADRDQWLQDAGIENIGAGYLLGDADLNGGVDGQDFIAWNANKFTATAAWSGGDFNGDGNVDGQDFIIWNGNKFTTANAPAVPEPAGLPLILLAMLTAWARRRA